jgi:hypothetical protein
MGGFTRATTDTVSSVRAVQEDDLEVAHFAETGLILVCLHTQRTGQAGQSCSSSAAPDLESQDVVDYLIMAQSCLKHKLINSVRELPID